MAGQPELDQVLAGHCPGVVRGYGAGRFGQIHYRRTGPVDPCKPILLLHQSPMSGYNFEPFMVELGRDRTVIAPDTPGFGLSDPPAAPPDMQGYAEAMFDFAAGLGLTGFDVLGYHTGGVIAVEMARLRPDIVRKIIMIGAPLLWPDEAKERLDLPSPKPAGERAAELAAEWGVLSSGVWRMEPAARRWNIFLDRARNLDMPSWGHRAVYRYSLQDVLPEIDTPILILNPEDDLWTMTPRAAPFLKNGRVHDLPGWCTGFLTAKAAETASIVRDFLDGP
jgi:pimeloyl-ACP methyl ester carboxylesterase